jgi:hypothetical protein
MNEDRPAAPELAPLFRAAREARIEVGVLIECVERRLVPMPEADWDDEALEVLRRARRMQALGLNLAGVEVALHMRARVRALAEQVARLENELLRSRREHEMEISRLLGEHSAREADT